ncbi:MAG: class I SAM-dependent methyltransferase [Elusimicrobia bacterium]|nr:class I SAM-dependent methyltransferase [Elusimicrobiota bacterium]
MNNQKSVESNRIYYSTKALGYNLSSRTFTNFRNYFKKLLLKASENCSDTIKLLDIGTGTGYAIGLAVESLKAKNLQLFGCDVSQDMMEIASKTYPNADLKLFDGIELPKYNTSFDIIVFCAVLHHIFDPLPLLSQAVDLLSENGVIIITQEPNSIINKYLQKFLKLLKRYPSVETELAEYHQYFTFGLSPKKLASFLKEKGLSVEVSYTNATFADEVTKNIPFLGNFISKPFLLLKSKFLALSYTIIAKK